jgi:hypothetical protein
VNGTTKPGKDWLRIMRKSLVDALLAGDMEKYHAVGKALRDWLKTQKEAYK